MRFSESVLTLADSQGSEDELKRFDILAYSGNAIHQPFTPLPIYIDLAGMQIDRKPKLPVLLDHKSHQRVGHTEKVEKSQTELKAEGIVSAASESAQEVIEASENGFEFEASVGAKTLRYAQLKKGETRRINGRKVSGPALIAAESLLREISFVGLGADSDTQAIVAESTVNTKETSMEFSVWLSANNIESFDELPEAVQAQLKASYEASEKELKETGTTDLQASSHGTDTSSVLALVKEIQASHEKREQEFELRLACGDDSELLADALKNKWSLDVVNAKKESRKIEAELSDLKESASIEASFGIHVKKGESEVGAGAIEAAVCMSAGISPDRLIDPTHGNKKDLESYGDVDHLKLTESDVEYGKKYFQGIGIRDLALRKANRFGIGSITNDVIKAALSNDIQANNPFTRVNLPTLFQNVVDRELIANYERKPTVWDQLCNKRSVRDFRETDRIRFGGLNIWSKVSDGGRLDQGEIDGEETFKNKAETYGQINYISRQHFINDDLGILSDLGKQMAFWGSMAPEAIFNTFLNDGTYYDGTAYYATSGATINALNSSPMSLDSFDAAYNLVKKRKSPTEGQSRKSKQGGNALSPFIRTSMKKLLVPSELSRTVWDLLSQQNMEHEDDSSSSGKLVNEKNFHYGRYEIIESDYISDAAWGGSNALSTTYYFMADPDILPTIEFVFLNGKQRPTVEAAEQMSGDRLGVSIRGYYDFGCNFQDKYASVRMKA